MVMSVGLLTRNKRFRVRIPVYWLFSFSFSYKYSRESIGIHWNPFLSVGFWLLIRNNMDLRRHHVNENAFSLYPIFILLCHNYCRVYNFTHEKWIGRVETVHSSSKIQLYLLYLLYLLEFSGIFWNFDFWNSKKWNYFSKNQIVGIPKFSTFFDFQIFGIPKIGTIFPKIKLQNFDFPLIILSIMSSILILPFVFSFINFLVISHYHPFHSIGIHTILTTQCIYHGFDNTLCRSKCIFLYHRFAFYHVLYTLYTVYYRFYLIRSGMDEWLMIFNRLYNQFPVVKSSWRGPLALYQLKVVGSILILPFFHTFFY